MFADAAHRLDRGWRRACAITAIACAFVSISCSSRKNLDDRTATAILQEAIDKVNGGVLQVPYLPVKQLVEQPSYVDFRNGTFTDNKTAAAVHRLVVAGFVEQTAKSDRTPDLTGVYSQGGTDGWSGGPRRDGLQNVQLSMHDGSPEISGHFTFINGMMNMTWGRCEGAVHGHVTPDGGAFLQFASSTPCTVILNQQMNFYRIVRKGLLVQITGPGMIQGQVPDKSVALSLYRYRFAPKFTKLATTVNGISVIPIGRGKIDAVDHLLLAGTDTEAECHYTTHFDMTALGKALIGEETVKNEGTATFRKAPDGDWALAQN